MRLTGEDDVGEDESSQPTAMTNIAVKAIYFAVKAI